MKEQPKKATSPEKYRVEVTTWFEPDSPLRHAKRRVNRAAEHLADLNQMFQEFKRANAGKFYVVISAVKPPDEGGDFSIDRSESTAPSPKMAILAGEIVYNLRAATDYLVYALARLDSGKTNDRSQFPIEEKERTFWDERRNTWLAGVGDEHVQKLVKYQPFDGCRWTRVLRNLSNVDKHRQLTDVNPKWTGTLPPQDAVFEAVPGDSSRVQAPLRDQVPKVYLAERFPIIETLDELGQEVNQLIRDFEGEFVKHGTDERQAD